MNSPIRQGYCRYCPALVAVVAAVSLISTRSARCDVLFASDRATDRILKFDSTTGVYLGVLTQLDPGSIPSSLVFGPGGYLYVGNAGNGKVQQIDPADGTIVNDQFALIGGVGGLAFDAGGPGDADDVLFVSEFGNFDGDEVYRFDKDGVMIEPLDVIGVGSTHTGRAGIALRDGDVYVSSFGMGEFFFGGVLMYDDADGFEDETMVASDFTPPATLNGANGLAFDSEGDLYVAGLLSQGVMKFDLSGGAATEGTPFVPFIPYPSGVLVADEGGTEVVYVSSLGNDRLGDEIYGNMLFPGGIYKYDAATGNLIGGAPLVSTGGASDHDDDGDVDGDDLAEWESAFNASIDADADNDGDSDGADFLSWQRNVGKVGDFQPTAIVLYQPVIIAAEVPEPSSMAMLVAMAAGLAGVRNRRRR